MGRRRGVTIVELMVSLAVISVITAAIVSPLVGLKNTAEDKTKEIENSYIKYGEYVDKILSGEEWNDCGESDKKEAEEESGIYREEEAIDDKNTAGEEINKEEEETNNSAEGDNAVSEEEGSGYIYHERVESTCKEKGNCEYYTDSEGKIYRENDGEFIEIEKEETELDLAEHKYEAGEGYLYGTVKYTCKTCGEEGFKTNKRTGSYFNEEEWKETKGVYAPVNGGSNYLEGDFAIALEWEWKKGSEIPMVDLYDDSSETTRSLSCNIQTIKVIGAADFNCSAEQTKKKNGEEEKGISFKKTTGATYTYMAERSGNKLTLCLIIEVGSDIYELSCIVEGFVETGMGIKIRNAGTLKNLKAYKMKSE